jgi:hypothetical protein
MPYIGKSPGKIGVRTRYYYTAIGSETSKSGPDDNGLTLKFDDGEYVDVFLNGSLLVAGDDYNTATANTISGLAALTANDVLEVLVHDVYSLAKTNSEAQRTKYYKTAAGSETSITGTDDNGATITFAAGAQIDVRLNGVSLKQGDDYNTTVANTVGGLTALTAGQLVEIVVYEKFVLADMVKKSGDTMTGGLSAPSITSTGSLTATNGTFTGNLTVDTNTLYVDSTNNRVGILNSSPNYSLKVGPVNNTETIAVQSSGGGAETIMQSIAGTNSKIGSSANTPLDLITNNVSRITVNTSGHVTMPYQPTLALQPDTSSNITTPNGSSHIVGWKTVSGRQTMLRAGLTLSAASGSTHIANGNNTGRITFSTGGVYYFDCNIRMENTPGAGNIYVRFNGTTIHRQHVEVWGRYPYAHGWVSRCITVSAGDWIDFGVACNSGTFSGSNDTVNWLTIMKVA